MDPSLMTEREQIARGHVVIQPCAFCHHNRQVHVYILRHTEFVGELDPITACLVCECHEFIDE